MASRLAMLVVAATMLICVSGNALPINFNQIPEQFKEFVPEEVTKFFSDLTEEDKTVLKDMAGRHTTFKNEEEALADLKEKSPKLHAKADELRNQLKLKIESLKPESQTFVKNIIEKLRSLKPKADEKPNLVKLRDTANKIITSYQALSDESKADLKANFPKISNIVHNEKFQKLAGGLLKTTPAN